jgi:hypothetical protein
VVKKKQEEKFIKKIKKKRVEANRVEENRVKKKEEVENYAKKEEH